MVRVQSEADSSFPGQLQDRVGRGREVAFSTDSRGRQQVVKSTSISMDELETLILPTRGKKEMINRMGQMVLSARYPEYHQHTLQYSVNDNPTISRLHVNPECPSRAYSFKVDLNEVRQQILTHPEYAPHIETTRFADGKLYLAELYAEDGTMEAKKTGNSLFLQLYGLPGLRRPHDKTRTVTSSHFRVPLSMGRIKEKRDVLYEVYRIYSAELSSQKSIFSPYHREELSQRWFDKYHMDDYKAKASKIGEICTA